MECGVGCVQEEQIYRPMQGVWKKREKRADQWRLVRTWKAGGFVLEYVELNNRTQSSE